MGTRADTCFCRQQNFKWAEAAAVLVRPSSVKSKQGWLTVSVISERASGCGRCGGHPVHLPEALSVDRLKFIDNAQDGELFKMYSEGEFLGLSEYKKETRELTTKCVIKE